MALLTPMLDCKTCDNGSKEYCDDMKYSVESKDVSGGIQRTVKKGEVPYVSVTSYKANIK